MRHPIIADFIPDDKERHLLFSSLRPGEIVGVHNNKLYGPMPISDFIALKHKPVTIRKMKISPKKFKRTKRGRRGKR
jgi:hypothetical protein